MENLKSMDLEVGTAPAPDRLAIKNGVLTTVGEARLVVCFSSRGTTACSMEISYCSRRTPGHNWRVAIVTVLYDAAGQGKVGKALYKA